MVWLRSNRKRMKRERKSEMESNLTNAHIFIKQRQYRPFEQLSAERQIALFDVLRYIKLHFMLRQCMTAIYEI